MTRALLHIGTPKTGSTSFQSWASANSSPLESEANTRVYTGLFGENHYELGLLCKRPTRNGFGELEFPDWCLPEWRSEARRHIRREIETAKAADQDLLISSEVISLLRHEDELGRLKDLLGGLKVRAVAAIREPATFLKSWRRQIGPGGWSAYRSSAGYSEPDSWLVDYGAMVEAFEAAFGSDALRTVCYEEALERHGSVIPAIAEALELDPVGIGAADDTPWLNVSRIKPQAFPADPKSALTPEIAELHRRLRLLEKEREGLDGQLTLLEERARERISVLEQELAEARHELDAARLDAERSSLAVASMASSASWRATRPARAAKRALGRWLPASRAGRGSLASLAAGTGLAAGLAALLLLA